MLTATSLNIFYHCYQNVRNDITLGQELQVTIRLGLLYVNLF